MTRIVCRHPQQKQDLQQFGSVEELPLRCGHWSRGQIGRCVGPMDVTMFIVILLLFPAVSQQTGCDQGWFGSSCQFMCRCTNARCNEKGLCASGEQCLGGWFGPACQYADAAYGKSNLTEVTDGDDETCVNSSTVNSVFISLNISFTWFRVHFCEDGVLDKFTISLRERRGVGTCSETRLAIDSRTLDVHCSGHHFVKELVIYGYGAEYVCSVFVSGGRNVALKQPATQSTTHHLEYMRVHWVKQNFSADLAVDGNRDPDMMAGRSCSSTNPTAVETCFWSVTLPGPCLVHRYILYNRLDRQRQRLRGFILESYSMNGSSAFRYLDRTQHILDVYVVQHRDIVIGAVKLTTINTADNTLQVCEVEIYGEYMCPRGRYGLECNNTCNCMIQKDCFANTGGCPSGCAIGYQGVDCTTPCVADTFGPSCSSPCSPFCVKPSNRSQTACDRFSGKCFYGCENGYEGINCDIPCSLNTYGPYCKYYCSYRCMPSTESINSSCNPVTGVCMWGCDRGYTGDFCTDTCDPNTYGKNCQQPCSSACIHANDTSNSSCNYITGVCDNGCSSGYTGLLCNKPCGLNTYGMNCQSPCSKRCLSSKDARNSSCNHITGACLTGCSIGYIGESCNTRMTESDEVIDTDLHLKKWLIITISTVAVIGALGAITCALFCIKKTESPQYDEDSL